MVSSAIQHTPANSYSEQAYRLIKEKIIRDEMGKSTVVSVLSLSRQFNIGRTPITVACKRLEQEGFLKVIPKQGVLINPMTPEDVREVYESRMAIEMFMAGKAFDFINDNDLIILDESLARQKICLDKQDPYAFTEEDIFFHKHIFGKYTNKTLLRMHLNLSDRIFFFGIRNSKNLEKVNKDIQAHGKMVEALRLRDKAELLNQIELHFVSSYLFATSLYPI